MKGKMLIIGMVSTLSLVGCSIFPTKEAVKQDVPQQTQTNDSKQSTTATQEQLSSLILTKNVSLSGDTVNIGVQLENKNSTDLPVTFQKDKAIEITLVDANGKTIDSYTANENARKAIKAQEDINWNATLSLNNQDNGQYTVNIKVNPINSDGSTIDGYSTSEKVQYGETPTYDYTPKTAKTLVYQNNNDSGTDLTEEFQFFQNGYAQSYNTAIGGTTVYYTDSTGYYRVYTEVGNKKDSVIKQIQPKKELLLKLPAKQGDSWDDNGVKQTVIDTNATVDTPVGTLTGCVEVEASIGEQVHFYYHKDYGLVRMDIADKDGKYTPMVTLKAVK